MISTRSSSNPSRVAAACALAFIAMVPSERAGAARGQQAAPGAASGDLIVEHVQGNVHLVIGPTSNSAVQAGDEGILIVDSGVPEAANRIAAAIKRLSPQPIRHIVNTSVDDDHSGGNEIIAKLGETIGSRPDQVFVSGASANILAHEAVLTRMSVGTPPVAAGRWPIETYIGKRTDFQFNGEAVEIIHIPAAHTDGDSIVMFRRSDVIATGDIYSPERYPVIDVARGGSIEGLIAGINRLLELTVPAEKQEGGTMVIAGHGRLSDEADVAEYRDMVTIVRDRVQDMTRKKMTLAQIKAARPTLNYDGVYGTPDVTPDMFVEAVHRSLTAPAQGRGTK